MKYKKGMLETARFMNRLYNKNLTTCSGGNISMKIADDKILITPSALDKGNLAAKSIAIVTLDGKNLTPKLKTSIETEMHLEIYRKREDINAIVHAHPVNASLFTASSKILRTDIIAEAHLIIGIPVMAPYALMGTKELALNVAKAFEKKDTRVVLMENHGVITVGKSLFQAYDRIEVLEAAAKMNLMSEMIGGINNISPERLSEIRNMF